MNALTNAHVLTQTQDVIAGMWDILMVDISRQWAEITSADLMAIAGDYTRLSQVLQAKYLLTCPKASDIVCQLAAHYDVITKNDATANLAQKAQAFWSEFTPADAAQVEMRRSVLTSLVQNRYALSRDAAWRQVNTFMAQLG